MKAFLMYRDRDFDPEQKLFNLLKNRRFEQVEKLSSNDLALVQDLELNTLFNAMARGDEFLFHVAQRAVLSGSSEPDTIRYRQAVLRDCLKNPAVVREIYSIPIEATENKKRFWLGVWSHYPSGVLSGALDMMQMFVGLLTRLRKITDEHADQFESEGWTRFFAMIKKELDDEYFGIVQNHLRELKFSSGVLLSAELGQGNEGRNYILRKPQGTNGNWLKRVFAKKTPVYGFSIAPRDEHGARALSDLRDRGINSVANALGQSADHVDSFLNMLRIELAFYIGCLNLYEQLNQIDEPISFPLPVPSNERRQSFTGLYDVCLALTAKEKIVGNAVNADDKDLVIITGANRGGKSTFLRSIGLAQLMMQCGMFVPAESFCANLCERLFTHYKRKEDATMKSGKLDEELGRMSQIVDNLTPNSLVLFNESFAATNEREGSEIARQVVSALLEKRIKVFFVTHLYEFARVFHNKKMENAFFLRAERQADGTRTFKLIEGEPLQTSYGKDLYNKIFGRDNGHRT